jgi:hypothetical protein
MRANCCIPGASSHRSSRERRVYDFVDDNPLVEFHPCDRTNDVALIRKNPRVTAINSAIEIDLTGQVCADSMGHAIYGGSHSNEWSKSQCRTETHMRTSLGEMSITGCAARGRQTTRFEVISRSIALRESKLWPTRP